MRVEHGGAYREDGYVNLLTNYGTRRDSSTAYTYQSAPLVDDQTLTDYYISNGLFAKIIDAPSERAATGGFDLGLNNEDLENIVTDALDALDWETVATEAVKWTRLFGGALGVMIIDDGGTLEQPLNYSRIKNIEEIVIFERPCVEPDYTCLYGFGGDGKNLKRRMRDPEYYRITSQTGSFVVHESRCLTFRANKLPELTQYQQYQFWGAPEYVRIKEELRETMVSHGYSVRMLERCIQAVHKMGDLALKMMSDEGEAQVLKRIELVDLARSLFNTVVIDKDGEDYGFQTYTMSGVKDILDGTCNMLSAVTQIPQTILFGRSPAGENATGESDMENYYGYLESIQKVVLKSNVTRLMDIVFAAARNVGQIDKIPKFKVEFNPLWSLSDMEEANLDKLRADAAFVRAQSASVYITNQVLGPDEVREGLKSSNDFDIEDLVDEESDWIIPEDPATPSDLGFTDRTAEAQENASPEFTATTERGDGEEVHGVGVLVLDGDKVLCATRDDGLGLGGPGGHIEEGETPKAAAAREAKEEFGIDVKELRSIGRVPYTEEYGSPFIFVCTDYTGKPEADDEEMHEQQWKPAVELLSDPENVFLPFYESLKMLISQNMQVDKSGNSSTINTQKTAEDGGSGSGNFGHRGVPGKKGGSLPATTTEALNEAIGKGQISTKLSLTKQSKHTKGSPKYNDAVAKGDYVSYMTVSNEEIEAIIKDKAGTGKPYGGGQHFKETIDVGKPVGFYLNEAGEESETTRITIHYGAKDCHVVPATPKKG